MRSKDICAVPGCKVLNNKENLFHCFPRKRESQIVWIESIGRRDLLISSCLTVQTHYKICSKHFLKTDYNENKKLKKNSIPRLYLPTVIVHSTKKSNAEHGKPHSIFLMRFIIRLYSVL